MRSAGKAESLRLSAVMCAVLVLTPLDAGALEIFGLRLFESEREETQDVIGTPQPYAVDFVVTGGEDDMEKTLKGASQLWADRNEPASGAAGLIAKARADYKRLLDALYAKARYGGAISITIDGQQVSELPPDTTLATPAQVVVTVNPGPLFRFDKAHIVNQAPPPRDPDDQVADPAEEGFRTGEPAESGTILRAGRLAAAGWRQQGYPKARVGRNEVVAEHPTQTIDATVSVEPGRHAVFGPVTVSGTARMHPGFIAWMSGIKPGKEYDPDDIERARKRLTRLDVFRATVINEADTVGEDGALPIEIIAEERPPRRIGIGGSYSTLDGLGLEAFWLHRNLFGRAERLRIEGRVSGIGETFEVDKLTYRLGATFTKPGVYTPMTDFTASVYGEREVLDSYTRTGVSAEAGFTHEFSEELSGRLFATGSHARFEDDFGTREFTTAGFLGGITYDTRDNAADATEGIFAELTAEPYYEFNYGNAAARFVGELRAYYSLDDDSRFVLAGRAKAGMLVDPPVAETPPDKLFFAGGGGSVRGYAYRNIGVETPFGLAGGRSLLEASAELRVRVTGSIGVVGFVDAGYVGADAIPEFSEDLRVGAGVGLRYLTGFGPLRLDVAVPLDPRPGDPDVAVYVGIGQAF